MTFTSFLKFSFLVIPICLLFNQKSNAENRLKLTELYRYGEVRRGENDVTIGKRSGVFLKVLQQNETSCLFLDTPGTYRLNELKNPDFLANSKSGFFACNLKALALRLKTPAQMIAAPQPRGPITTTDQANQYFEKIWEKVALNRGETIPAENLVASAIWYSQDSNPARSAYLLEKAYKQTNNSWLLELHHEAYASASPKQIEQELDNTRNRIESAYSPESNLALLIGVQNYKTASGWKSLNTPLNDINEIKSILVEDYSFKRENVYLLPDATYQQMLDAIGVIKKKTSDRTNLLIYYAGHGWVDEDGEYFWIPSDGEQSPKTWIYTDFILNKIKALNSLHTLFIVDSCFGGALNNHTQRGVAEEGMRQLYEKRSRQLITAGGLEPVADGGGGENSVFAGVFIDILRNQPKNTPLSVDELFASLQPSVVKLSNQTPTYDRLPDSRDEWGQFYFVKKRDSLKTATERLPVVSQPEDVTSLPAELMNDFNLTKPAEAGNGVADLNLFAEEIVADLDDILDNQRISHLGASISFKTSYKNNPLLLQLSYAAGKKEQKETIDYQNQEYKLDQSIEALNFKLGLRRVIQDNQGLKYSESGVYYNWKRFRVEWDTSDVPGKRSGTEYVNVGYHMLNLEFFQGWQINDFLDAGFNYDVSLGIVSLSGSTAVARTERFNTDSSNFIAGAGFHPEIRFRFPVVHLELQLGAGTEYLWQPVDDQGNAQSGDNTINSSLLTSNLYAIFSIEF
ncbi:MAG: caspase family protein [Proteobacteria bacterium]|nr:caspase family protein [Pseudomonadota bacterium]